MSYFSEISRGEKPLRAVWVPFLETLAAEVEGCELTDLIGDATRWANALPKVAKLLGAEVLAVGFIDGFGAESFAVQPDEPWKYAALGALLECTRRLAETVRPDRELVVALPGPASICHRGLGKAMDKSLLAAVKPTLVKLLEMMCECRPDMVVINEVIDADTQLASTDYQRMCNTLKNVAEYFGVPLGIRVSGHVDSESILHELRKLRLDHLMIGQTGMFSTSVSGIRAVADGQGWQSVGITVTSDEIIVSLPQQGTGYYWCSATQEQNLEQARKIGLAVTAA